ncbi:MAG: RluA family pseudouridine synthase [Lachnospiraceae bacterium]|nr:RluA family pseudouridine synthase [Lachnospiraceae bacterium]
MKVLYEDDDIIVVHKAPGIAVQSGSVGSMDLVSEIKNYLKAPYIGVVHRLDQPVEGVMVFGKTKTASAALSKQVRDHIFNKRYDAIVVMTREGIETTGRLEDYILSDRKTNRSTIVEDGISGAKKAILDYRLRDMQENDDIKTVRAEIDLYTGRHHQIRLQMSHAGMPVLGDRKYSTGNSGGGTGLCLAATSLGFKHPVTGKDLNYQITPEFLAKRRV